MTRKIIADVEAERGLVGAGLINSSATIAAMAAGVAPEDFYDRKLACVFAAQVGLVREAKPTDIVAVTGRLKDASELSAAGGLVGLLDAAATGGESEVSYFVHRVLERSRLRSLHSVCLETATKALTAEDSDAVIAEAQRRIVGLSDNVTEAQVEPAPKWAKEVYAEIEAAAEAKEAPGVAAGLWAFDRNGGLGRGHLDIIAGRPSMGKTALLTSIANNMLDNGCRGFIASLEMPRREVICRLVASRGDIDCKKLLDPRQLSANDWAKAQGAFRALSTKALDLWCPGRTTIEDLRIRVLRSHAIAPLDFVGVDYLQLVRGEGASREERVSEVSRTLKALAKEVNAPVIALCQLNRGVEHRDNKRPVASDLRDSGQLEQDADLVSMLYRPAVYDEDANPEEAELIFVKNRHDARATVDVRFLGAVQRFQDK